MSTINLIEKKYFDINIREERIFILIPNGNKDIVDIKYPAYYSDFIKFQ